MDRRVHKARAGEFGVRHVFRPVYRDVMLGCLAVRWADTRKVNPQTVQSHHVQVPRVHHAAYRQGWSL